MTATPGRAAAGRAAERLVHDVSRAGELLLGEAVRRAPIEEGTLRGSATLVLIVNGERFDGEGALPAAASTAKAIAEGGGSPLVIAEVAFNTVYAAAQHEGLDFKHPKGGGPKYLEGPLGELAPRLRALIAAGQRAIL